MGEGWGRGGQGKGDMDWEVGVLGGLEGGLSKPQRLPHRHGAHWGKALWS